MNQGHHVINRTLSAGKGKGRGQKKTDREAWPDVGVGPAVQQFQVAISGVCRALVTSHSHGASNRLPLGTGQRLPNPSRCLPERGRGPAIRLPHWFGRRPRAEPIFGLVDIVLLFCAAEIELALRSAACRLSFREQGC